MKRRVLDTSVLLRWWNWCRSRKRRPPTPALATRWARELIAIQEADAIVTPVILEVLAGTTSQRELQLMRAFLQPFKCLDHELIPAGDWREARRIAQRVPRNGKPRGFGDCLIRAIANRFSYDVLSYDDSFPD
jgi:predicted nucleic acid-binding protein